MNKTIVLLSAKRSGSTAIFKCFQKHSQVKIAHHNQEIDNWEIQYWSLASEAISGNPKPLIERLKISFPEIKLKNNFDEKYIFDLWNYIVELQGGIIFDKSPQYLGNYKATNLLEKFILKGNEVKIICLIRDPRDTVTSQYELWSQYTLNDSLKRREKLWIEQYKHYEVLSKKINIPIFYYEKLARDPDKYFEQIYNFCEIRIEKNTWTHIKPISVGRYSTSLIINKKDWTFSEEFGIYLKKYNYERQQIKGIKRILFVVFRFFSDIKKFIPAKLKKIIKNFL